MPECWSRYLTTERSERVWYRHEKIKIPIYKWAYNILFIIKTSMKQYQGNDFLELSFTLCVVISLRFNQIINFAISHCNKPSINPFVLLVVENIFVEFLGSSFENPVLFFRRLICEWKR